MPHKAESQAVHVEYDRMKPLEALDSTDFDYTYWQEISMSTGYGMRDYWSVGQVGDQYVSERDASAEQDQHVVSFLQLFAEDFNGSSDASRPVLVNKKHASAMKQIGRTIAAVQNITRRDVDDEAVVASSAAIRGLAAERMRADASDDVVSVNEFLGDGHSVEAWVLATLPNGEKIGARFVELRMITTPSGVPQIEPVVTDRTGLKRGLLPDEARLPSEQWLFFSADRES